MREARRILSFATLLAGTTFASAQPACTADGYRVVSRSWDAVLGRGWEMRQQCAHPEQPLRLAASLAKPATDGKRDLLGLVAVPGEPLLVKAGDPVLLWRQETSVRLELSGVVERSARRGEHVFVQVSRHDDDAGLIVQRISGVVNATDEVEMDR